MTRARATWAVGRREWLAMIVGVGLYGGLSWMTNIFPLQAATDLQIRPGMAVPIVFGFIFGPVVGFVTGALGNLAGDLVSGLLPYVYAKPMGNALFDLLRGYLVNWQLGNGLMGLIPGLAALAYRRYWTWRDQLRALAFAALGVIAGMGVAAFLHPWVDFTVDLGTAFRHYFLPVVRVNLLNAVILVPILLFNYERIDLNLSEWLRSGLLQRLTLVILISAALPVALLGLFLTQQTTGMAVREGGLTFKLAFTVVLTLLFTAANAALLAQSISRPLLRLTGAARSMEAGRFTLAQAAELKQTGGNDEVQQLSRIFGQMAQEVIVRYDEVKQRNTELQSVYEIAQAITASSADPNETLQTILERVAQMIGYHAGEICLYVPEEGCLQVRAWKGPAGFDSRGRLYKIGEGFTGWIGQERRGLLVPDIERHPTLQPVHRQVGEANFVRSYVGVPLLVGERLVGTLELVGLEPGAFDAHTQRLLETIALQAAIAIETAQRVEERERRLKEQIAQLRIEIDEAKKARQVAEITETDYFRDLRAKARQLRDKKDA